MKLLLLISLVASALAQSQNTEFVDYMIHLQHDSETYYDWMTFTFREARSSLANHLVAINTAAVTEVTDALRQVILLREATQGLIDSSSGSVECISAANTTWRSDLENAGENIASCIATVIVPINNATDNIQDFISEQSAIAFEVQNLVLYAFSQINIISDSDRLTPFLESQVNFMYTNFNDDASPHLFQLLDVLRVLREIVPTEVQVCVNAATARLNDESIAIGNTLELC